MLALFTAAMAHAGVIVGGMAGTDVPLDNDTTSDAGLNMGLLVGWRQDLLLLHIQPEIVLRYNVENQAALVGPGVAVTALSPVAVGVYAHVGLPASGGPTWDAGGVAELTLLPKIRPGVRVGYQRARIGDNDDDPLGPADNMLHAALVVGVKI